MGGSISGMKDQARQRQEQLEKMQEQVPAGVDLDAGQEFTGSWIFSIAGALIAIPVGIKRKSLAPLVFYGSTGAMLDVIMSVSTYEWKKQERLREYLEQQHKQKVPKSSDEGEWETPDGQQDVTFLREDDGLSSSVDSSFFVQQKDSD